jgi:hypothetical protein
MKPEFYDTNEWMQKIAEVAVRRRRLKGLLRNINAHFLMASNVYQRTIIVQLPSKCLKVSCVKVLRQDFFGESTTDRVQD